MVQGVGFEPADLLSARAHQRTTLAPVSLGCKNSWIVSFEKIVLSAISR